jgi:hypothetical protein
LAKRHPIDSGVNLKPGESGNERDNFEALTYWIADPVTIRTLERAAISDGRNDIPEAGTRGALPEPSKLTWFRGEVRDAAEGRRRAATEIFTPMKAEAYSLIEQLKSNRPSHPDVEVNSRQEAQHNARLEEARSRLAALRADTLSLEVALGVRLERIASHFDSVAGDYVAIVIRNHRFRELIHDRFVVAPFEVTAGMKDFGQSPLLAELDELDVGEALRK